MSSGFLVSSELFELLRKPYHVGDTEVTTSFLVEGFAIGAYRVLLKQNFDTACWVPPAGKKSSHSIYYGDRMLSNLVGKFAKKHMLELPTDDMLVPPSKKKDKTPTSTKILNAKLTWLRDTLDDDLWAVFNDWMVHSVTAYGRHEREHARHTCRDLTALQKDLKSFGIPFRMFNLFEDARIEHKSRQSFDEPFGWLNFEELCAASSASAIFLRCIQLEEVPDEELLTDGQCFKDSEKTIMEVAKAVKSYYERAITCTASKELIPIIREFLTEFPEEKSSTQDKSSDSSKSEGGSSNSEENQQEGGESSNAEGNGNQQSGGASDSEESSSDAESRGGDLSTAAEASEKGDSFFEDFDSDAVVVGGTDAEGKTAEANAKEELNGTKKDAKHTGQGIPESIGPQNARSPSDENVFLAKNPGKIDATYQKRIDALTAQLMTMFKTHSLAAATETPRHRMSSRHLARGEFKWIEKKIYGGKGKRKYTIVYDCSASMNVANREGKIFLLALNNIAKRGFLEGSLILSGWYNDLPCWVSYKFPVKDEIILRMRTPCSSEGLQYSLLDNLKSLKNTDDVFVYTDACICDTPLNRDLFAAHKVWPVGLYVGTKKAAAEMEVHFPQNIVRDTIEQVVEAMLIRNRRTI